MHHIIASVQLVACGGKKHRQYVFAKAWRNFCAWDSKHKISHEIQSGVDRIIHALRDRHDHQPQIQVSPLLLLRPVQRDTAALCLQAAVFVLLHLRCCGPLLYAAAACCSQRMLLRSCGLLLLRCCGPLLYAAAAGCLRLRAAALLRGNSGHLLRCWQDYPKTRHCPAERALQHPEERDASANNSGIRPHNSRFANEF